MVLCKVSHEGLKKTLSRLKLFKTLIFFFFFIHAGRHVIFSDGDR